MAAPGPDLAATPAALAPAALAQGLVEEEAGALGPGLAAVVAATPAALARGGGRGPGAGSSPKLGGGGVHGQGGGCGQGHVEEASAEPPMKRRRRAG